MDVIIAGCGRVGAQLAVQLDVDGHDVVVIDKNPLAFRRLGDGFRGRELTGIVFDRATLEEAGIRRATAFVAVTSGDNSNIVSARTAKERYGIAAVVARIYDPDRAAIYERHGITTIASARWTAEAILRELLPADERVEAGIGPGAGDVVLVDLAVPEGAHGVRASSLDRSGEAALTAITRDGVTQVPVDGALLEAGDRVHLAVQRTALDKIRLLVADLGEQRS